MSYKILVNGSEQEICECHNEGTFEHAVEIFKLFDDSRINNDETPLLLKKLGRDFKFVFYWDGTFFFVNVMLIYSVVFYKKKELSKH